MLGVRLLPWEYGVRNLLRRPGRSALTLLALTLVVLLVFVVVGFIRGLETSLAVSGDPRVVLVHSVGASENVENSSIPTRTTDLLAFSLQSVHRRSGPGGTQVPYASPELYLGTQVSIEGDSEAAMGLVRAVTPAALLVRNKVQLIEGRWPGPGEVLVGRLAAAKLGREAQTVAVGRTVTFEGRTWRISGHFAALGSALESELWCPLDDLQKAMKRQDLSVVALTLTPGASPGDIDVFCKEQLTLELQATPETAYYEALRKHYEPVRALAWLVVLLVAGAGVFAGLNTMYGAVVGRVRELATLQTLGFVRRAIALSLVQEAVLLAAAGSLLAAVVALLGINGVAVRFTMGAFTLRIDGVALAVGCGIGLLLGVIGAIPPAVRAMRLPVAEGLKAV
ncbi:MAG: ABC transporter permease [Gemmataceae bacterium]|nr:ABC transporter permease [Gemmataceae bacterium]